MFRTIPFLVGLIGCVSPAMAIAPSPGPTPDEVMAAAHCTPVPQPSQAMLGIVVVVSAVGCAVLFRRE